MSDSVRPHRWQPTRLPSLGFSRQEHWSGLHFPSPRHGRKSESEVAQLCPTLSDPMDCSLPGSSTHGIFQARVLEWGAIANSSKVTIPFCIPPVKTFMIGEGNGNPLQYSSLENPRDRGACWAAIYEVVQSRMRLRQLSSSSKTNKSCSSTSLSIFVFVSDLDFTIL